MSDKSEIGWTDATWNVVTGCTRVSPGCAHCYIERTPPFRGAVAGQPPRPFVRVGNASTTRGGLQLHPDRLDLPLRWRPRRIFVNSLSDLFHEDVPDSFIGLVFSVMAAAEQHTFQVLTKRPERMRALLGDATWRGEFVTKARCAPGTFELVEEWPLNNVWLGVSVENQHWADVRIPLLLETPAAVRFISAEPLLGPVDLCGLIRADYTPPRTPWEIYLDGLDWVIAGGESAGPDGPRRLVERCTLHLACRRGYPRKGETCGECMGTGGGGSGGSGRHNAGAWRPKPEPLGWVRSLRDQCVEAGVPFFFKQWGGPTPKSGGRWLDRRTWDEMPAAVQA